MKSRKLIIVLSFFILGIFLVFLFWKFSIVLSLLLVTAAYVKHRLIPIKKELQWFVVAGILGAVGESLIMISGPWSYASPNIINFPIWLVFLWGYTGAVGISLYQAMANIRN